MSFEAAAAKLLAVAEIDNMYVHLGESKLRELVASFYAKVKEDDLMAPMYPDDDWEGSEDRLYMFLAMRFGGPKTYLEKRGHPRLRMRHMPFRIGIAEKERWLSLMGMAMDDCGIKDETKETLHTFFLQVAEFMRNRSE